MNTPRVFNFSSGPAVLPLPVLEEAQRDLVSLPGVGMSVLEISHRSKPFDEILHGAHEDMRAIAGIPDNYRVLFLQGGASLQFSMVPMNLLTPGLTADYIVTGDWGKKALKEAKKVGTTSVAASTEDGNFKRIPAQSELRLTPGSAYVHMTTNNTIHGTQWHRLPDVGDAPLVADASSDIFSRPIEISKYGLIYAGAQKNLGPSGVTVVIVRDDLLSRAAASLLAQQSFGGPLPDHAWELLEDKDWEREWMNNYHAIQCGKRLWICPSWQQPPEPDKVNLMLDPGLAFGTGTHPTTFMCLQWIDQQDFSGLDVMDYGCGSGILGIATLLLNARKVIGVDIDPQALLATTENARRNNLPADAMPVYLPPRCPKVQVDVMLANILAGPLAQLAPNLNEMTRLGGRLCLSGILAIQADEVMSAYHPWFDFEPIIQHEEWVCLTAQKKRE
jgi:ribosomal protein L11 methyltransferase